MIKNIIAYFTAVMALVSLAIPLLAPVAVNAQTTSSNFCYTFSQNLGEGRPLSSQDATALTTALTNAGVWTSGTTITTYNDSVASAVSGFQEKYASQILAPYGLSYGTGFVGVSTRSELNSLYGCSTPTQPVQSTQCPAGYTCTPINQNPATVCPAGYTCTPITTTPTQPTITNISNPVTVQVGTLSTTPTTNSTVIQTTIQSLPVAPQILYPVGGEILQPDISNSISWNPISYTGSFDINIIGVNSGNSYIIAQAIPAQATDKQSIQWIPKTGSYQKDTKFVVQICRTGTTICAKSNSFTINFNLIGTSPSPVTQSAPQILYPIGGEILSSGVPTSISWNPINYSNSFDVSIKGVYTGNIYSIAQNVPAQATDKQSIQWTPNLANYQKEPSGFVIQVCVSGTNICAQSANSFIIQ